MLPPLAIPLLAGLTLAASPPPLRLTEHRPLYYALDLRVDPAAETIAGHAEITVALDHGARSLWLNAQDLEIHGATLRAGDQERPARVVDQDGQRVRFAWEGTARGEIVLEVDYTAPVSSVDTSGAFSQREADDAYLFTQLEPLYARRLFPCFDQPEFKTPYALTLHVPEGLGAYANAPLVSETPEPGGLRAVHFAETEPLPTYLFAFAVGPFEEVDAGRWGRAQTPVRVLVPRGRAADAGWAVEVTGPILEDLERYFDLPFPYAKLDVVSLPRPVGWGAMENAGLVTMEQGWVLSRPEDDTPGRRRDYAEVIAHELAHHWFGDLVTPAWWDDLWLNESFATWMSLGVLEARWPDWKVDVTRVAWQGDAMAADSLSTARAVRQPIRVIDDIEGAFDGITYLKGSAILTMVEGWLGPETFRAGVRRYLSAHAWGSATAEDFVGALSAESGVDLSRTFSGLLERPGLPELSFSCTMDVTPVLSMTQARWLPGGPARGRWEQPACVRFDTPAGEQRACAVVRRGAAELPLEGASACSDALVLNDGQRGYYRARYPEPAVLALLAEGSSLSTAERVGVLQDASGAVTRGELAPATLLGALPGLLALDEPRVTSATLAIAAALDAHLVPADLRPSYARFLRQTYGPLAAELGLAPAPDEDEETRLLRPEIIGLVGLAGQDPGIAEAARPLAERWLSTRDGVEPELVPVVLALAGQGGGMAWFERLRDQLRAEPDRARREMMLEALGLTRDPSVVPAMLDWVSSEEIDAREALPLFFGLLAREDTALAQWTWAKENLERLEPLIPAPARGYLTWLGSGFCSEEGRAEVERFFAPRVGAWTGGRRLLAQQLESIATCAEGRARQEEGVRAFLSGFSTTP